MLFADLKGSMELLADRDPEEARKLLDPVLERMMEAVHRYEGTVNQVMGDGIMALFGAPLAHEDHAVRACYAALRMQERVKQYSEELRRTTGCSSRSVAVVTFSPAYPLSAKTRWMNGKMHRETLQKRCATIAVLDTRRMRFEHEAAPVRVHERMALTSVDLLSSRVTRRPRGPRWPGCRGFPHGALGRPSRPTRSRSAITSAWFIRSKHPSSRQAANQR